MDTCFSTMLAGHSYFVENVILSSDSQFALSGDSEYDNDNEGNNLDFEEEEESVSSATASYSADKPSTTTHKSAEDLLKEVKQLLGPEERDILQQNATPNLGKISTVYISGCSNFSSGPNQRISLNQPRENSIQTREFLWTDPEKIQINFADRLFLHISPFLHYHHNFSTIHRPRETFIDDEMCI
ncbi:unnamed protein product [Camellia sinensis]